MGRRQVLGVLGAGAAGATGSLLGLRPGRTSALAMPVDEPSPTSTRFVPPVDPTDVEAHVARRLTFGTTPEVLEQVHELGWRDWIAWQLHPDQVGGNEDLEQAIGHLATPQMSSSELVARFTADRRARRAAEEAGASQDELRELRRQELHPAGEAVLVTVLRAVHNPTQLHELLVDHWSNHFNVHIAKSPLTALAKGIEDRDVIRPGALGRFSDLLVADAQSPAMLAYLDQADSRADGSHVPNENYAREVLELHTVGAGAHDEQDVLAMAHVLAGWTVDRRTGSFRFRTWWHEAGPRTVLAFTTAGRSGAAAVQDGEDVLRHLAAQPATARNVVTRLARRFVSDAPSDQLVVEVAATYLANDTALRPTLEHLLTHDEFVASAGRKFKRPFELLASSLRALDWHVPDLTSRATRLRLGGMHRHLEALGQSPFGWPAPNGHPDVAGAWRNTGAVLSRWNLAQALTGAGDHRDALANGAGALDEDDVDRLAARIHPDGTLSATDLEIVRTAADEARDRPRRLVAAALLLDARPFQYR